MEISHALVGLLKTTTVNFPGRLAIAVFLPGCNLRCPYCYNAELARADSMGVSLKNSENTYVPLSEVFDLLEKRRQVINALAISGGEPLTSILLPALLDKAAELDYEVKLDTNGLLPDRLEFILKSRLHRPIATIALDVKTAPERYAELSAGSGLSPEASLKKTAALLTQYTADGLKVEYRTVLVPKLVEKDDIRAIAQLLPPDADWEFARFTAGHCLDKDWDTVIPYTESELNALVSYAQGFIPTAQLR